MDGGHVSPRQVILALEVVLSDLDVAHGHSNVAVAEDFLQGGKADSGTEHDGGISMPELVEAGGCAPGSFCGILQSVGHVVVGHLLAVGQQ